MGADVCIRLRKKESNMFSSRLFNLNKSVSELLNNYPPRFGNAHKRKLYQITMPLHKDDFAEINIVRTKFQIREEKEIFKKNTVLIKYKPEFFNYISEKNDLNKFVWHLNFADENLFGFYGTDLFAQDEIQVLEMPLLACVREFLLSEDEYENLGMAFEPYTNENQETPTPFLIKNVPYWLKVNTDFVSSDGKNISLYGNNFIHESWKEIQEGISLIHEKVFNNIIAISAPKASNGKYSKSEIEYALKAAACAFEEAVKMSPKKTQTVIHTGNWGCGAFGGNKELMYLVQIIAASLAGVKELVFHAITEAVLTKAKAKFMDMPEMTFADIVDFLYKQEFTWESGDGN